MTSKPNSSKEIRARLVALGLDPNAVDLEWLANVEADVSNVIDSFRQDARFDVAEPLFQPEHSRPNSTGGD